MKKSLYRKRVGMIFLMAMMFTITIFCISLASAEATWDNSKSFIKDDSMPYGKVIIKDAWGLGGTVEEIELKDNDGQYCGQYCSATFEIHAVKDNIPLVESIRFLTIKDDGNKVEQPIRNYKIYIKEDKNKAEWKTYTLGQKVSKGKYELKIEGEKKPNRKVDWQISSGGTSWTTEWAVWGNLIFDDFADNVINTTLWNNYTVGASGLVEVKEINGGITSTRITSNPFDGSTFLNTTSNFTNISLANDITFMIRENMAKSGAACDCIGNDCIRIDKNFFGFIETTYCVNINIERNFSFTRNNITSFNVSINGVFNKTITQQNYLEITTDGLSGSLNTLTANITIYAINGNGGTVTLDSPANNYISPTNNVQFNCSAQTSSGATLVNMYLWTNSTGTWAINQTKSYDAICYQETANQSTVGDGNCGLDYSGNYSIWGAFSFDNPKNIYDGNWNSYSYGGAGGNSGIRITYLKPLLAISSSLWQVKFYNYSGGYLDNTINYTIPSSCWSYNNLTFNISWDSSNHVNSTCYNGTNWLNIFSLNTFDNGIYEEAMIWDIGKTSSTETFNNTYPDGSYNWSCQACDSDGDCGMASENRTISVDTTAPLINILYPIGTIDGLINGASLNLNYSVTDTNLGTCWKDYNLNTNTENTNITLQGLSWTNIYNGTQQLYTACTSNKDSLLVRTVFGNPSLLQNNYHTGPIECQPSSNIQISNFVTSEPNCLSETYYNTITFDNSMVGKYACFKDNALGTYVMVKYNLFDNPFNNMTTFNVINKTYISCTSNSTFNYILGRNTIQVWANDSVGNMNYSTDSWIQGVVIENSSYNNVTYETSHENFYLNFSSSNLFSARGNMIYNGTAYPSSISCTNGSCVASNHIDIPLISGAYEEKQFYWTIDAYTGSGVSTITSSIFNQTVYSLSLTECSSGTIALNFTTYDEQNKTRIMPFIFDGTIDYYTGNGITYKTLNISNKSTNEVVLCINRNTTYYLNAIISYSSIDSTYTLRNWFYQNYPISNATLNVPLYLLKSAASTSFILKVQDKYQLPVEKVLVEPQRCYTGTNTIETVFKSRTDNNGLTVGNFEAETALYQFLITNNSRTLLAVTPCSKVVPQTTPYTLTFNIGDIYVSPFFNIENATNINSNLYFNYTNRILTFDYVDSSGNLTLAELIVRKLNYSGNNQPIICYNSSNLSAAILTCNLTNEGSYSASAYIYRSPANLIQQIVFLVQSFSQQLGYYGVFLGFFIILISAFAFKFNEIAGIWLVNLAVIFCNIIGLIDFGKVFVTAIICLSILITAILER